MKKIIYFILVIALVITGYTIWKERDAISNDDPNPNVNTDIKFSDEVPLQEMTFDADKSILSFTLKNNTKSILEYGASFRIMKLNAQGVIVETDLTDELAFDMMLRMADPGKTITDEILFELFPKPLEKGTYYIIREYRDSEGTEHIPEISFVIDNDGVQPVK